MLLEGACGVHWAHGPISMISAGFKDSHFEFQVNQELYGCFSVIIGFLISPSILRQKNEKIGQKWYTSYFGIF